MTRTQQAIEKIRGAAMFQLSLVQMIEDGILLNRPALIAEGVDDLDARELEAGVEELITALQNEHGLELEP